MVTEQVQTAYFSIQVVAEVGVIIHLVAIQTAGATVVFLVEVEVALVPPLLLLRV